MSEFKYACPVCGQHIKCDSSQAGTVMECPTCFQKITVPQAPTTDDQKFILTGTKKGERPVPKIPEGNAGPVIAEKKFPMAVAVVIAVALILLAAAGVAAMVFKDKIFKPSNPPALAEDGTASAPAPNKPRPKAPPKPAVVAPPASDTNWMLSLDGVDFPATAAAGRIHGQDFIVERANFSTNGTLTIRNGTRGPVEFGLNINFSGARAESLAGQTINIAPNVDKAARVTLRWRDASGAQHETFDSGYAMRLQFGPEANNRIPGKIYLCAPDEMKSYVAGTLTIDIRRPRRQ
jgi:DNA-directed RNA polymerase subunit RPC12/RpoP